MVVVDPHDIAIIGDLENGFSEFLIRAAIGISPGHIELCPLSHVVEERPERSVRVAFIEAVDGLFIEKDWFDGNFLKFRFERGRIFDLLERLAGPADPGLFIFGFDGLEGGGEAAGGSDGSPVR